MYPWTFWLFIKKLILWKHKENKFSFLLEMYILWSLLLLCLILVYFAIGHFFIDWLLKIEIRERESGRICGMRESESKMEREKSFSSCRSSSDENKRTRDWIDFMFVAAKYFLVYVECIQSIFMFFFSSRSFSFYKFYEIEKKTFNLLLLMICAAWKERKKIKRIFKDNFLFLANVWNDFHFFIYFFNKQCTYLKLLLWKLNI